MPNYKELLAALPFDIGVEALAAALLENTGGLADSAQLKVRPRGHLGRVEREVTGIAGTEFNAAGQEVVYLDVNREGLYDTLPEMLFFDPAMDGVEETEKTGYLARQQEASRRFLLPFEQTFYQARIDLEVAERRAVREMSGWLGRVFRLEVPAGSPVDPEKLAAFALVLPLVPGVVGKPDRAARLLSSVLGKPVTVVAGPPAPCDLPPAQQSVLGEALLGVDLVLGALFADGIAPLAVTIAGVDADEAGDWLPGGRHRLLVEDQLLPYLLPAEQTVTLEIEVDGGEGGFTLGEAHPGSLLGYTTKLN
jgi:hypothetical protein